MKIKGILCLSTLLSPLCLANVVLINPFTVPEGKLAETIDFWDQAHDFLANEPGYVSTKLHQSISPDYSYQLINVAEWESIDSFKLAIGRMNQEFATQGISKPMGTTANPNLFVVIRE
ncbi:antibiotic biosynthesis monooxygenase [Vibrio mediterranei]|nr:antibiotic biosynthesis monooxygenase [Vibrio mediterranei]